MCGIWDWQSSFVHTKMILKMREMASFARMYGIGKTFPEAVKRESIVRFVKVSLLLHKQRRMLGLMCKVHESEYI